MVLDLDETLIHSHHDGCVPWMGFTDWTCHLCSCTVCIYAEYMYNLCVVNFLFCFFSSINPLTPLTPPDFIVRVRDVVLDRIDTRPPNYGVNLHIRTLYILLVHNNFLFHIQVTIESHPVRFFVHKRPHVDFFLFMVY